MFVATNRAGVVAKGSLIHSPPLKSRTPTVSVTMVLQAGVMTDTTVRRLSAARHWTVVTLTGVPVFIFSRAEWILDSNRIDCSFSAANGDRALE